MPLWPYVINTRILAEHLETLVVKTLVNVGTPYHRTKYIIFWVRIPVEPLITYFWKVKMKINENSAWNSFLPMCITYVNT